MVFSIKFNMKKLIFIILILFSNACSTPSYEIVQYVGTSSDENLLDRAESEASDGGKRVLTISRSMINNKEIFIGGCWDYINEVYNRAGIFSKVRDTVFQSKFKGPYLNEDIIQPGDWLYFVNHTYKDSEHSAIFVAWTDKANSEALMINYVGENKKKPAMYKRYILDNVYNVMRAKDN
jgi:hypothetical protein